jgi:hypothetical protein
MLYGEKCFYDEFGVRTNELHKKFTVACNNLHSQFKEDFPLMQEYGKKGINYYAKMNSEVRKFIRTIIKNIVKYLVIEMKKPPIYINLEKCKKSCEYEINLSICLGKKHGKYLYGDTYVLDKEFKKSDLKKISNKIENDINIIDSEFDLNFVLFVIEKKLGIVS